MGDSKLMVTITMNEFDSPVGESERLNLRIIADKKAFSVGAIVESITALLRGNEECLYDNVDFFSDTDFDEEGGDIK